MAREEVESAIKNFLRKQGKEIDTIQGRNPNIENYYAIWRGCPDWLDYKVWLPKGGYKAAKRLTLNMGRHIPRLMANNYANEDTKIVIPNYDEKGNITDEVPEGKTTANDLLQRILKEQCVMSKFNQFAEMFLGVGIGAIVVGADKYGFDKDNNVVAQDSKVKIQFVGGTRVYPITIEDGEVTECAFVGYKTNGCTLTIHFKDENGNYCVASVEGKTKNDSSKFTFDYENADILKTNSNIPLFTIWHPSQAEEQDFNLSIGTPIFYTAIDVFKSIDVCYTMFHKEMLLGQKKIFIQPSNAVMDAEGNVVDVYDPEDESVVVLGEGEDGNNQVQEFNGQLRTQQIIQAINFNLNMATSLSGLGGNVFEFEGGGGRPLQTATAVVMKQTEAYRNIIKQENFARDQFRKLVQAIAFVNNTYTTNDKIVIKDINDITIVFDDNIMEDTNTKKEQMLKEINAGVKTLAEFRAEFGDESLEEAKQFVFDNALLADKYLNALQIGAMTIGQYCELVYGEVKPEVVEAYNAAKQQTMNEDSFGDEADEEPEEEEVNADAESKQEEGNDQDTE